VGLSSCKCNRCANIRIGIVAFTIVVGFIALGAQGPVGVAVWLFCVTIAPLLRLWRWLVYGSDKKLVPNALIEMRWPTQPVFTQAELSAQPTNQSRPVELCRSCGDRWPTGHMSCPKRPGWACCRNQFEDKISGFTWERSPRPDGDGYWMETDVTPDPFLSRIDVGGRMFNWGGKS
jgi:hypothetical protein